MGERKNKLQPGRIEFAKKSIERLGFKILTETATTVVFLFKEKPVTLFPYTGWHSGKTIKDGRGLKKLLEQLENG